MFGLCVTCVVYVWCMVVLCDVCEHVCMCDMSVEEVIMCVVCVGG